MPNEEEEIKVEITKAKFVQGLNGYTSWMQVKSFIKKSPAVVKNMTLGNMQIEIDNMTGQRDNLSEMIDFMIALKAEIEAI
ncbi:MAG: hypothetical protein KAT69_03190 [Candidatus Aminicenantes bacterium]|nr:hypothetical protein [Candidatus Aminicenantes bacterium]